MRTILFRLLAAGLLSVHAFAAPQTDCNITQDRVDAVLTEVVPALEEALGGKFDPPVRARLCERSEIAHAFQGRFEFVR